MSSSIHVGTVAFCRKCGKPLTNETLREWQGVSFCEDCLEVIQASSAPGAQATGSGGEGHGAEAADAAGGASGYSAAPAGSGGHYVPPPRPSGGTVSPVLAAILGFIPGVGAVYNGQFAKGVVHVVIFGLLISIVAAEGTGDLLPLFVLLIIAFGCYMPVEAYRTARAIERGEPVEEFSGILSVVGRRKPSPAGGVALIVVGVVFLLNTLGYWRLGDLVPYWPVMLIALGIYMLYRSVAAQAREDRDAYLGGGPRVGGSYPRTEPESGSIVGSEPAPGEEPRLEH